ncbi:rhodanese-like domain-containing protein [bacterium]|nr:rhodanese-like domain-containing protein [bacterium]
MNHSMHARDMVEAAMKRIVTISVEEAREKRLEPNVLLVDIREYHELERDGMIPDAINVPRGILEFCVDSTSPYCLDEFLSARVIVLYCQAGARSALAAATLQDMGIRNVCHIEGGFAAWQHAQAKVVELTDCLVLRVED